MSSSFQSQGVPIARPLSDPSIRVQIPAGLSPGDQFIVHLENGSCFTVIIPTGSLPGQYLDIIVPHETQVAAPARTPDSNSEIKLSKAQIGMAGAGAAAGLLFAGPITACALAGAGAYAASRDGVAGHTAKEMGKQAFDFGVKAAELAKQKLGEAAHHLAQEAERQRLLQNGGSGTGSAPPVVHGTVVDVRK